MYEQGSLSAGDSPGVGGYDEQEGQIQADSEFWRWVRWPVEVLLLKVGSLGGDGATLGRGHIEVENPRVVESLRHDQLQPAHVTM